MKNEPRPEVVYRQTTDPAERRRLQADVVSAYRANVASIVRRMAPADRLSEGVQVGSLGVLVALEKYNAELMGEDRGGAFWHFARLHVRNELQLWLDSAVYWRKYPNRGKSPNRVRNRELALAQSGPPMSLDLRQKLDYFESSGTKSGHGDRANATLLIDSLVSIQDTPESLSSEAQLVRRLRDFVSSLPPADRELLLGSGPKTRSRHYLSLVAAAKTAVRGSDDDGSGDAV